MTDLEKAITAVVKDPYLAEELLEGISIVLDSAPDWPIVLTVVEQSDVDDANEAACECDPPYLWKAGDVRYEVSDGFPGHRHDSFNFVHFRDAVDKALALQHGYQTIEEWHAAADEERKQGN